jgi:class 3 adenylate cyclase
VRAAQAIQRRWGERREALVGSLDETSERIGVGVGIATGKINFGEFGHAHHDLTAIGTVVNIASRAQSAAAADEILVTEAVYERARSALPESPPRDYRLKGFAEPVKLWAA